ncbi:hypothetical protein ES703_70303 [subsurface metagenome]
MRNRYFISKGELLLIKSLKVLSFVSCDPGPSLKAIFCKAEYNSEISNKDSNSLILASK